MAHPKHDGVRSRYAFRCGYCGVHESDTGGELSVDHYQPVAAGGDDSDDNLVYACMRCNLYKGDFYPTDADLDHGWRVLHPLRDPLAQHIRRNDLTGTLEGLTETGRFHIKALHLNRSALVAYRLEQQRNQALAAKQQLLEAQVDRLRALLIEQERYISHLRRLLGFPSNESG